MPRSQSQGREIPMSVRRSSGRAQTRLIQPLCVLLALGAAACAPPPPAPAAPSVPASAAMPAAAPSGPLQTIRLVSVPADARCSFRQGAAAFAPVPAGNSVQVDRGTPLDITCRKPGFRTTQVQRAPSFDFGAPAGQQMAFPDVVTVELSRDR